MPLVAPDPITSARLVVRPIAESDLAALLAVNGDEQVTGFLPYATWQSMVDAEAWYQRMLTLQAGGTALQFVVADRQTGSDIGTCLLFRYDEASARAELGYVMGRSHWGRGCMREALQALIGWAFDGIALRRLEAEVDPRNARSAQLLLRLGFTKEGLLRQRWITKGLATDVEVYGLLRHEWPGPQPLAATGTTDA